MGKNFNKILICHISPTTPPMPLIFVLHILHCICHINWNFLKIILNFLKMKNSSTYFTASAIFWRGKPCYMSPTRVALFVVRRRYYWNGTFCVLVIWSYWYDKLSFSFVIAQVVPGLLVLLIIYLGCDKILILITWFSVVTLITASYAGAMANIVDIAPNFAGR